MILYHASTSYHVLCCIVHKLVYHPKEEAVFMIVEHMLPKESLKEFIRKLESYSWFTKIISVPEGTFRLCHGKTLNANSNETDILEVIHNICKEVEAWYPEGFSRFEDIYVASDQWSIGVYLLYHKIPYHYFEDASGMLGDEERYLTIIRDMNLSNYIMCNYLRGAGRSEIVIEKLCDMNHQPPNFSDNKAVDFSIYQNVLKLSSDTKDNLLELYGAKKYKLKQSENIVVFMSQFLRTLTIKNLEVQEHITTLLLDYFASDSQIIIKPHPKDRWINYKRLIPDAILLNGSLPSELLPFVLEGEVEHVITASSTSIGGMSNIAKNTIHFGTDIECHYKHLHSMYATALLINEVYKGQKIWMKNIKRNQFEYFLAKNSEKAIQSREDNGVIYIDGGQYTLGDNMGQGEWERRPEDLLIFINYAQKYDFLLDSNLVLNNFLILHATLSTSEENSKYHTILEEQSCPKNTSYSVKEASSKVVEEYQIWVYLEADEERRKVLNMNHKRILKYSGLEIEISTQEATYAMILNGKMKALQYALKQKENEEKNIVFNQLKEVIKQYQEEDILKRIMLEEEGMIHG